MIRAPGTFLFSPFSRPIHCVLLGSNAIGPVILALGLGLPLPLPFLNHNLGRFAVNSEGEDDSNLTLALTEPKANVGV